MHAWPQLVPPPVRLQGDIARWAVVWVFCIHQTVTLAPALEPQAAALLDEEELAHYSRHGKPRFAVHCKVRVRPPVLCVCRWV